MNNFILHIKRYQMNFPFLYIFNCNFSFSCNFVMQRIIASPPTISTRCSSFQFFQDCLHLIPKWKGTKDSSVSLISLDLYPYTASSLMSVSINFGQRLFGSALFSIPCHVRDFCIMGHDLHEISYRPPAIVGCKRNW